MKVSPLYSYEQNYPINLQRIKWNWKKGLWTSKDA